MYKLVIVDQEKLFSKKEILLACYDKICQDLKDFLDICYQEDFIEKDDLYYYNEKELMSKDINPTQVRFDIVKTFGYNKNVWILDTNSFFEDWTNELSACKLLISFFAGTDESLYDELEMDLDDMYSFIVLNEDIKNCYLPEEFPETSESKYHLITNKEELINYFLSEEEE